MRLKSDIKKIFDKLKKYGCGFNHIKYEPSRKLKISNIFEEGSIAKTISPKLKHNTHLECEIFFESFYLYKINKNKELIYSLDNWQDNKLKLYNRICFEYEKLFYTKEEIINIIKKRKDFLELNQIINSIYPELKIREVYSSEKKILFYAGASFLSFEVEKSIDNKKTSISTLFYGSGSYKYQRGNKWNLCEKYRNIVKNNIYQKSIYNLDLSKYKNIYEKCKKC